MALFSRIFARSKEPAASPSPEAVTKPRTVEEAIEIAITASFHAPKAMWWKKIDGAPPDGMNFTQKAFNSGIIKTLAVLKGGDFAHQFHDLPEPVTYANALWGKSLRALESDLRFRAGGGTADSDLIA
jgi:hypothetical protein